MRLQTVERKAEWAERKNILWPETCWTLRARDQRLCRGGEGCSLACSEHINHHREDILKANYMECFLGKSSPRPCKSSPALAGTQICLGGGGCASAPQCQVEELHRALIWSLEPGVFFLVVFIQGSRVEPNYMMCLRSFRTGTHNWDFPLTALWPSNPLQSRMRTGLSLWFLEALTPILGSPDICNFHIV